MEAVVGVFKLRAQAERTIAQLRDIGIAETNMYLLAPESEVPVSETEQPGMGAAFGGLLGAGLGAAGGATVASMLLPGIGPVVALGAAGAAMLGAGGAAAGSALEHRYFDGLPADEVFVYEDALRKGRSVLVALTENESQATAARGILGVNGAESVDSAREQWWIGLRSAEEEHYQTQGANFKEDELTYRRGFQAALDRNTRGRPYEEVLDYLRKHYPDVSEKSFRHGYERGQAYYRRLTHP